MENIHKHLEMIQGVINRMSSNSFLIKGWAVTLVAALFALAAGDTDQSYVFIAYLPIISFWGLDAYFLQQERKFVSLYNEVRVVKETDYRMDVQATNFRRWASAALSATLLIFYGSLLIAVLVATKILL